MTTKAQAAVADGPATGPAPGVALAGSMEAAMARRWPSDVGTSDSALRQFLHGLPGVDTVGAQQRAAGLATRSIKRDAKLWALDMAVRTSVRCAMHPSVVRISAMGSICTPVCFATAV